MCSPQIVLDKIVEKIVEIAIQSVGRHLGYPFHYKKNVKNLEVQMDELQALRRTIEGQIEEAKTGGEVIMDNVSAWLNGADGLRQGVETFMHEKIDKENVQCFKFSCPDFISRYKLSKEAEKKMGDVKSLSEKANFGTISKPAPPPPELQFPSSEEYVSFDSRESVFNRIKDALTDTKVNVVGVYGLGGVGKTTMVEKVGEQVKKDGLFDEVVMTVVSQDENVVKIQGVLADHLNLKLEAELTEVGRRDKLWNRLNNGKRNLVILDDIWKKLNLKEIGIPITDGKKGCKVILTSRNQHVLKDMQVDKDFLIQVLSEQEAWNLFKKKINVVNSHDPLHDIAKAVCRECRGLPVAILAVGAALKGKRMHAWKSSLDKLKKSMMNTIDDIDPKLFTSLRLSYDYLESPDAKLCFLLCCLFPEDSQVPIEALARHCMTRRLLGQKPDTLEEAIDIVRSVIDALKTRCLLLDGKNDDFVKMHDVIRDVAISIAKEDESYLVKHGVQEWPETGTYEKYSAISLRTKTIHELPDELVCPELHTLMLECSRWWSTKIPDKFFKGSEKLMVLELNKVTVLPLPSSLENLTELRMLCLNECKLGDIAILKDLKNKLEVLRLRGSDIKALPPELGELTRLRLLDLGDCRELEVRLDVASSISGEPLRTRLFKFVGAAMLEVAFPALEELDIDSVPNITEIWDKKNLLPTDQSFCLLRSLKVWNCEELMNVVPSHVLPRLRNVEDLDVYSCSKMEVIVVLEKREEEASNKDIIPFPEPRKLELKYLENLKAVCAYKPEDQLNFNVQVVFPKLRILRLLSLGRLSSFNNTSNITETRPLFNHQVAFPGLEELDIGSLPNITEIWDKKNLLPTDQSFCLLRSLNVWRCEKLMNVVPSHVFPRLRNVETLEVRFCLNMEVMVVLEKREQEATNKDIIPFPELRTLELRELENLKGFCAYKSEDQLDFNVQDVFPKLREQDIHVYWPSLKNFNQECAIMDESGNRIRLLRPTSYDGSSEASETESEELESDSGDRAGGAP